MVTEKMLWMVARDLFRASTEMAKALCHGWMAGTSQDKPDHVGLLAKAKRPR